MRVGFEPCITACRGEVAYSVFSVLGSLQCETSLTDLNVWKSPVWLDFSAPLRKSLRLWQRASLWPGHRSVQTGSQDRCGKDGCPRQWCHEHDPGETGKWDSCFISLESISLLILVLVFVFIPSSGPLRLLLSSIGRWDDITWTNTCVEPDSLLTDTCIWTEKMRRDMGSRKYCMGKEMSVTSVLHYWQFETVFSSLILISRLFKFDFHEQSRASQVVFFSKPEFCCNLLFGVLWS